MKTLEDVIKAYECKKNIEDKCNECPYFYECDDKYHCECEARDNDVLHYLKEYQKITDVLHKHGFGSVWGITLPNPKKVEGKPDIDGSMNQPFTWDELKQMKGKPVWMEEPYSFCDEWHGYWEVISSFFDDDYADEPDSVVYMTNEEIRHKNDLGKTWQAYREER